MARSKGNCGDLFAVSDEELFWNKAAHAQSIVFAVNNPYIGNKKKLLFDIAKSCYKYLPYANINSICDLFAGSSVVGCFFKLLGKQIHANELLLSSYMHGVALHRSSEINISKSEWDFLCHNKNTKLDDFVTNKYMDKRFTKDECLFLDNYYANSLELYANRHVDFCSSLSLILQFVMENCFLGGRLNSGQIIAEKNHRIAHQRNQGREMNFRNLMPNYIKIDGPKSNITHGDAIEYLTANPNCDLYYIDPPYGGDQSDYASMYKFCEEFVWRTDFDKIDFLQKHSKKFAKHKNYQESFEELLSALPRNAFWLFSYNDSSWADADTIKKTVEKFGRKVTIDCIEYPYKLRNSENMKGREFLIFAE